MGPASYLMWLLAASARARIGAISRPLVEVQAMPDLEALHSVVEDESAVGRPAPLQLEAKPIGRQVDGRPIRVPAPDEPATDSSSHSAADCAGAIDASTSAAMVDNANSGTTALPQRGQDRHRHESRIRTVKVSRPCCVRRDRFSRMRAGGCHRASNADASSSACRPSGRRIIWYMDNLRQDRGAIARGCPTQRVQRVRRAPEGRAGAGGDGKTAAAAAPEAARNRARTETRSPQAKAPDRRRRRRHARAR